MPQRHQTLNLDRVAAASARAFVSVTSVGVLGHHLEVFGVTLDGELRHRWHDSKWSAWTKMPTPHDARATHVAAAAHGRWLDLFIVSPGGRLFHRRWGEHDGWSDWHDWGDGFAGPIAVASGADYHNEVWVQRRGVLVHKWLTNHTWSDWHEFT